MSTRLHQRRARLRAEYGFDFPDDFYRFWEFANRLSPLEPLRALEDLDIHLVGPFEVLAGRFDGRVPRHSLLLHWRLWPEGLRCQRICSIRARWTNHFIGDDRRQRSIHPPQREIHALFQLRLRLGHAAHAIGIQRLPREPEHGHGCARQTRKEY